MSFRMILRSVLTQRYYQMLSNAKKLLRRVYLFITKGIVYFSLADFLRMLMTASKTARQTNTGKKRIIWVGSFPAHHWNVGDQAQTLAIDHFLHENCSDYNIICFTRNDVGYSHWNRIVSKINDDDIIIISSTGDFGSKYIDDKKYLNKYSWGEVRKEIVKQFPNNKIIQLPVTVYYEDNDKGRDVLQRDKQFYDKYQHFIVLCRESRSLQILKSNNICDCEFFPDFVFYLKPEIKSYDRKGVLLMLREHDKESKIDLNLKNRIHRTLLDNFDSVDVVDLHRSPFPVYRCVRRKYMQYIMDQFQKYELIVTDRMHGMIIAVITRTPCIAIDDNIPHKISAYRDFLADYVGFIDSINDFTEELRNLKNKRTYTNKLNSYFDSFKHYYIN